MKYVIFVVICYLITVIQSDGCEPKHACDNSNPEIFIFKGLKFNCDGQKICNRAPDACTPCVDRPDCSNYTYACDGDKILVANETVAECPKSYICVTPNANCNICVRKACTGRPRFKCDIKTPNSVFYGGTEIKCPPKYKCNENFVEPCDGCITDLPESYSFSSLNLFL